MRRENSSTQGARWHRNVWILYGEKAEDGLIRNAECGVLGQGLGEGPVWEWGGGWRTRSTTWLGPTLPTQGKGCQLSRTQGKDVSGCPIPKAALRTSG